MSEIRSFRDLYAWQVGIKVVERTYELTADFPNEERSGLVSQMRRASVSIPSNVAEGNAVVRPRWTIRFLLNSVASACELATQLEAALRLGFCTSDAAKGLNQEIEQALKLLYG